VDKELLELIDATMKPLERFRFARKRIVAAALAEAANELLNDGYYDVLAHSVIRGLKHKEALRRGRESLMMRKVADDLLTRLRSADDSSLSDIVDAETKPGSVINQSQHHSQNEPLRCKIASIPGKFPNHNTDEVAS
jgi:hypothetical protein